MPPQAGWTIGSAPATSSPTSEDAKRKPQAWTVGNAPTVQQPSAVAPKAPASAKWGEFAKTGPYKTELKADEETKFKNWVKENKIPFENDSPTSDYDMRGFWKAQQAGDPNARRAKNLHFPDTYKTPYHETFSKESKYALPTAGHWEGDKFVPPTGSLPKPPLPPKTPSPTPPPGGFPKGSMEASSPFTAGVIKGGMLGDPARINEAATIDVGKKLLPASHPYVRMGGRMVADAAKGMGDWMDKVVKDPFHAADPVVAPFENLARMLEFHTGEKHDVFGLKKAGIDETVMEQMARGLSRGDTKVIENAAGKLLGGVFTLKAMTKSPEIAKAIAESPTKVGEMLADTQAARHKDVITASANNVLEHDARNVIVPTIVKAVKSTQESIGRQVKGIADADRTNSAAAGKAGSFTKSDLAQSVQNAVNNVRGQKVPKPGTASLVKSLGRYGNDLSWEDMKDIRSAIENERSSAGGKDAAILGKLYEDVSKKLEARAKALGKGDEWTQYNELTRKLNDHKRGIINDLQKSDTGLKLYQTLAKESNKPQLNDMFGLLEKHGGVPKGFVEDMVKSRKPIYEFAKRAESGGTGGRMAALIRHPLAAGTAMIGTGGAISTFSPIPMSGSFVASLIAAQKAAEFMDRYDAAKAIREIGPQATPVAPKPLGATPRGGGSPTSPMGQPVPPTPSGPTLLSPQAAYGLNKPPGQGSVINSPAAPSTSVIDSLPSKYGVSQAGVDAFRQGQASAAVGAPTPTATLDDFMSRVSDAQKRQQMQHEAGPGTLVPPETSRTSTAPTAPPTSRWSGDRGAMPGEPMLTLDNGKAAIVEIDDPKTPGRSRFAVQSADGKELGVFSTPEDAAKHAEKAFPLEQRSKPRVTAETSAPPDPMRVARISELRKIVRDKSVDIKERAIAESQLIDLEKHPGERNELLDIKSLKKPQSRMTKAEADAATAARHAPAEPTKPAPYEEFGVKIDKAKLTTPESVRSAKADAKLQIEELGRTKYKEIAKINDVEQRSSALKQLDKDVKSASRSVDKLQTPEVSRKARDRVRKAEGSTEKPSTVVENLSPGQVTEALANHGITASEDAMMRGIDLQLEAEAAGPRVLGVYNQILEKYGGDSTQALPMLEALMKQVRSAKKPPK